MKTHDQPPSSLWVGERPRSARLDKEHDIGTIQTTTVRVGRPNATLLHVVNKLIVLGHMDFALGVNDAYVLVHALGTRKLPNGFADARILCPRDIVIDRASYEALIPYITKSSADDQTNQTLIVKYMREAEHLTDTPKVAFFGTAFRECTKSQ